MTGLSIGVHLLNLLCIPAIVLVYCYRKFPKMELKGSLIALVVSFVIVAAVLYGVVPGIITVGGWFELFFVNILGCPFNTGEIVYIILLVATVVWAIYESYSETNEKRSNISFVASFAMLGIPFYGYGWSAVVIGVIVLIALWFGLNYKHTVDKKRVSYVTSRAKNTTLLCMLMLMIGYSSYALIVIRSAANPPMDQNSPEDIFTLGNYLSRDQYGDRPLLYGQAYTSQVALKVAGSVCKPQMTQGAPIYSRKQKSNANDKDSYFIVSHKNKYQFAQNMLFPRMYDQSHAQAYEDWMGGVDGTNVSYDRCGENVNVKVPSQLENLRFFLSYHCNFMYWRYFMWNFAGRQNDIQGNGELEHGNWITGISVIDNARLGDQSKLPDDLKANKGHNVFYMLPLILGLIGLFWQAYRGKKGIRQFWVVFFLFFMTGIAIVLYLNQTPTQPRERDYAYAGSFYAFTIWIGLGVAAIVELLDKLKMNASAKAAIVSAACLLIPIQMGSQTWDDHDRSHRYTCRDFGQNYLNSMQQEGNPIIFTNGDNDTYPLWYNQETEGVRTDTRVCNLSYLQTDWYIDQLKRPSYDAPAVPITWSNDEYVSGTNDYCEVAPAFKEQIDQIYRDDPEQAKQMFGENPYELKNIIKYWIRSKDPKLHVIPTDSIVVPVDRAAVIKSGMMLPSDSIPKYFTIGLKGRNALYKNHLMMLEMLANSNWVRPIYFAVTVGRDNYLNMTDNFVQEGLAYRVTPFNSRVTGKFVDVDKMYNNLMHRFKYGNISDPQIYLDQTTLGMCYTHRRMFSILIGELIRQKDTKRALEVLKYADKMIPESTVPYENNLGGTLELADGWINCGQTKKGQELLRTLLKSSQQFLDWYSIYSNDKVELNQSEIALHFGTYVAAAQSLQRSNASDAMKYLSKAQEYYNSLSARGVNLNMGN